MAFFLHRGENGYWRRGDSEGAYTVHCQNKQDYSVSNLLFKYFSCICSKLIQNYSLPFYGGMGQTTEYTQLATAAFWRTFYHDGKIAQAGGGGGVHAHPLSQYLPWRTKLQCTLQLRVQIHSPSSLLLWFKGTVRLDWICMRVVPLDRPWFSRCTVVPARQATGWRNWFLRNDYWAS
jgi:hypothetical protein